MTWIVRSLAAGTVLAGLVVALHGGRPNPEADAVLWGAAPAVSTQRALPDDWTTTAIEHMAAHGRSMSRSEIAEVIRTVDRCARRFAIDPLLVLAVMEVESRFDPYAVSSQGAIGLMQVLPDTARETARRLGIAWQSDDLLYDPAVNIEIGSGYLKALLDRFGDADAALAAYHAGPGRVEARLARLGSPPLGYSDRVWDAVFAIHARMGA